MRLGMFVVVLLLLGCLPLATLPSTGAADYSYSLSASLERASYGQGAVMKVIVDVSCTYLGDRPYSIDEQVTVNVDIALDGKKIGHGTVPAGPLILNPGQTLTFHDTFMATIPSGASCGQHTVNVIFSASALGMSESRTRTFSITVTEAGGGEPDEPVMAPLLSLSLSPTESFPGGISTLTMRIYNPNNRDMDVRLALYRLSFKDAFFLETVDIDVPGLGTGEARSSYRTPEGLSSLGFRALVKYYHVGHNQIIPDTEVVAECHAIMLQRPLVTPVYEIYDVKNSAGYITSKICVSLENEYSWDECVLPTEGGLSLSLPDGCSSAPLLVSLDMTSIRDSFTFALRIPESIRGETAHICCTLDYPESYNAYPDEITVPFLLPSMDVDTPGTQTPSPGTSTPLPPVPSVLGTLIEALLNTPVGSAIADALNALDTWVLGVVLG